MSGLASIILTVVVTFRPTVSQKPLLICLAAIGILYACYQVWRDSMDTALRTIETLSYRPYDEAHKKLAEMKLEELSEECKDAVNFLLHHGETEGDELVKHCKRTPGCYIDIQRARENRLLVVEEKPIPGRAGVRYWWRVNPVLRQSYGICSGRSARSPRSEEVACNAAYL